VEKKEESGNKGVIDCKRYGKQGKKAKGHKGQIGCMEVNFRMRRRKLCFFEQNTVGP
jgi:hypothetical protein